MSFDVYPTPPSGPLTVPKNSSSGLISITTARVGPDNVAEPGTTVTNSPNTMFIRLVMLSGAGPDPTISLSANGAALTEITGDYFGPTAIPDGHIADAFDGITHPPDANNVVLVKILFNPAAAPNPTFQIAINNHDLVNAHAFTWVVASSLADSRQGWIDVPTATVEFDALTSQSPAPRLTVVVSNNGTGPLTITDAPGANAGNPNFKVAVVPPAISPNATGNLQIDFNPPAAVSTTSTTYTIGSNDTTAGTAAGHNKAVALKGVASQLEVVLLVDASGSMGYTPNGPSGSDTGIPVADTDARWGKMKIAAKQFLDLLGTMGSGEGQVGIAVFPDFTGASYPATPAPCPSAGNIVNPPLAITAANIATASGKLDAPPPLGTARKAEADKGATPIGFGIGFTIGTDPASFGYFKSTDPDKSANKRFLVLMTDGKNNCGTDGREFYDGTKPSFNSKNIKVITVGYGNQGGTFEVDPVLLGDLATHSNGTYLNSGADNAGLNLKKDFRSAIATGLSLNPIVDPGGVLTSSQPEARAQVLITPYDTKVAFVVSWKSFSQERVSVSILTPGCELITQGSANSDPNITFHENPTYVIFGFNNDYLRNAADPSNPRYGTWRLIITGHLGEEDSEPYDYEVITESRLKLALSTDRPSYFAGDTINFTAALTLDGLGVPNGTATAVLTAPGTASNNFLATSKITTAEFSSAQKHFTGADVTAIGIKAFALSVKDVVFTNRPRVITIPLKDEGDGRYTASFSNTSPPGDYEFYVTVLGQTFEGVSYRREKRLKRPVDVRPLPDFTLFETVFRTSAEGNQISRFVDVTATPRDQFGNFAQLVDPRFSTQIAFTTTAGEAAGALTWNLDGSYSQTFTYPAGTIPSIGLTVGGETVVPPQPLPPVEHLRYADRVVAFHIGGEAAPGANHHKDPNAALGDVTTKSPETFVSLGAFGSLTLAIDGHVILASDGDDITVFAHPDDRPRPYSVEVLPVTLPIPILIPGLFHWVPLGTSTGGTRSFSLRKAGVKTCVAIRIKDLSGITRTDGFQPSNSPGAGVVGLGVKDTDVFSGGGEALLELIKRILDLLTKKDH